MPPAGVVVSDIIALAIVVGAWLMRPRPWALPRGSGARTARAQVAYCWLPLDVARPSVRRLVPTKASRSSISPLRSSDRPAASAARAAATSRILQPSRRSSVRVPAHPAGGWGSTHRPQCRSTRAPPRLSTRIPESQQLHHRQPPRNRRLQTTVAPSGTKNLQNLTGAGFAIEGT